MRRLLLAFIAMAGVPFLAAATARADSGPVIVIPSRPGIPIVINGVDASYAVVEGDWGLSRPGAVPVTVYGGAPVLPTPVYTRRNSYHPRYGRTPLRGRYEIEPPEDRALPEPAEDFSRSWSTSSDPVAVSDSVPLSPSVGMPYDAGNAGNETAPGSNHRRFHHGVYPPVPEHRYRHRYRHRKTH